MREILFYGLDERGDTAHTERLKVAADTDLKLLARDRLHEFHAVEIWEGPLCVARLRRRAPEEA